MIKLPAVEYVDEGDWMRFKKPRPLRGMVDGFLSALHGWVQVSMAKPGRPRSTGWKSQNHHIAAHETQISLETGCSFEAVRMRMKQLCIGWPHEILPDESSWPMSEADADTQQAAALIETIHAFAAEYGIILIEDTNEAG